MIIRAYNKDTDMAEVSRWYSEKKWPHPPVDDLVPDFGLVAVIEGILCACGFVYTTSTSKAELSWLTANPDLEKKLQSDCVYAVIKKLTNMAMELTPPIRLIEIISSDHDLKPALSNASFYIDNKPYKATYMVPKERK